MTSQPRPPRQRPPGVSSSGWSTVRSGGAAEALGRSADGYGEGVDQGGWSIPGGGAARFAVGTPDYRPGALMMGKGEEGWMTVLPLSPGY